MHDHFRTYFARRWPRSFGISLAIENENHVCQTFTFRLYRSILVSFSILFYWCVSHA